MTKRQPPGTPIGGQFAPDRHPDGSDLIRQMPEGFSVADWGEVNNTSLVGHIATSYNNLVKAFGEPQFDDESNGRDKSTMIWRLHTPAGVATIYDPDDERHNPLVSFTWRIGGIDQSVLAEIARAVPHSRVAPASPSYTYDFGKGPVPVHEHPNGGGLVADSAYVDDTVFVGPDAKVCDEAEVFGRARILGDSVIRDQAVVSRDALVINSVVENNATVTGDARVIDRSVVRGSAKVIGFATVSSKVTIENDAVVADYAMVFDRATVGGDVRVIDYARVHGRRTHLNEGERISGTEDVEATD